MKTIRNLIIFLIILGISALSVHGLYQFKPTTKKIKPKAPTPMVKAMDLVLQKEKLFIEAFGTVIAARKVDLHPEVEGRIIDQNPELVPGGIIPKGSFMVQVDRRDYQLKIRERQAEVAEAESQLELEKGQQNIATRELQLFKKVSGLASVNERLALREPHMKDSLAVLEAAKSRLAAAELAESRTTILSPFNALVLDESVGIGQLIGRQTTIATLVETDIFWIKVSVPLSELGRIKFAGPAAPGSAVRITLQNEKGANVIRLGNVFKMLGDLDPKGRMARILVSVEDPLLLKEKPGKSQSQYFDKILLGSYVKVDIEAGLMENVYVVPRQAMRDNENVWILTRDNTLDIRPTIMKWRRKDSFLVEMKVNDGEKIITSRLQSPLPGMPLKTDN